MKQLIFLSIALLCGCSRPTGFTLKKITTRYSTEAEEPMDLPFIQSLFDGPLVYLGSGNHTYAFATQQNNYVIKFFKQNHFTPYTWKDYLPLPKKLNPWRRGVRSEKLGERKRNFDSFRLAQTYLPDETGIVYLHLGQTKTIQRRIKLVYREEYQPECDIDRMEFIIQRRVQVGFEAVNELLSQGKSDAALNHLAAYLQLIKKRCLLGLGDEDLQFYKNFGFDHGHPVEIDIGDFYLDPSKKQRWKQEVSDSSQELIRYLENQAPHLIDAFQVKIQEVLR